MESSKYEFLKPKVLDFLSTVQVNDYEYRFTVDGDYNIYSSVLALYIFDLFDEVEGFSRERREGWVKHIQSFQNKESGCFEPKEEIKSRKERNVLQLTTFCFSALKILDAEPLYDLPFKDQLLSPDFVNSYLDKYNCLEGARGSGNMAMFLGIFITEFYEKTNDKRYFESLHRWFDLHTSSSNENGFWGNRLESLYYNGVQNGFHQYVIYYYWNELIEKKEKITEVVLKIQDNKGHFAPFIGGAACEDYDAIHMLLLLFRQEKSASQEVKNALIKSYTSLLKDLNKDGGFCQSKLKPNKLSLDTFIFILNKFNIKIIKLKLRKTLGFIIRNRKEIKVNWFKKTRTIDQSNLWDTWFKVLAIAEIEDFFQVESNFKFLKAIGLGNYNKTLKKQ
jgi:prenyltransferase beta subunit